MKKNGFSHIRKWLWGYAFVIVLLVFMLFGFTYKEISDLLTMQNWTASTDIKPYVNSPLPAILSGIKIRVLFIMTVGFLALFFITIAWFRFTIHRINVPIYAIRRAVYRLAQGKLNETVSIESNDEFGQIGSNINELAANLQELLLYIWKQSGQCIVCLDNIKKSADPNGEPLSITDAKQQLEELSAAIENMRQMAKAYVFYDVRLDGEQTLAINNPGQETFSDF